MGNKIIEWYDGDLLLDTFKVENDDELYDVFVKKILPIINVGDVIKIK